jgi:hypothetical protein
MMQQWVQAENDRRADGRRRRLGTAAAADDNAADAAADAADAEIEAAAEGGDGGGSEGEGEGAGAGAGAERAVDAERAAAAAARRRARRLEQPVWLSFTDNPRTDGDRWNQQITRASKWTVNMTQVQTHSSSWAAAN